MGTLFNKTSSKVKKTPSPLERKAVRMIVPWTIILFIGFYVGLIISPNTAKPPSRVDREIFTTEESSNNLSTIATLSIREVRDQTGKTIMPMSQWVILCPGDLLMIELYMAENGHISNFELTEPNSNEPTVLTYSISHGSEVVNKASITIEIPKNAKPGDKISVPWKSNMYLIYNYETERESGVVTEWFDLIKPFNSSGVISLPVATPEMRAQWIRINSYTLYTYLFRYFLLASGLIALLLLARRRFTIILSICFFFAGVTLMFGIVMGLIYNVKLVVYLCIIAICAIYWFVLKGILNKFHYDAFKWVPITPEENEPK